MNILTYIYKPYINFENIDHLTVQKLTIIILDTLNEKTYNKELFELFQSKSILEFDDIEKCLLNDSMNRCFQKLENTDGSEFIELFKKKLNDLEPKELLDLIISVDCIVKTYDNFENIKNKIDSQNYINKDAIISEILSLANNFLRCSIYFRMLANTPLGKVNLLKAITSIFSSINLADMLKRVNLEYNFNDFNDFPNYQLFLIYFYRIMEMSHKSPNEDLKNEFKIITSYIYKLISESCSILEKKFNIKFQYLS
uniref:Uncharacterized protein n=1 Tax=viral metagenome TaxID=1070528 RepID=A0A6C0JB89_9ZZZZ